MPKQEEPSPDLGSVRASVLGDRGVFVWQKAIHVSAELPEPVRYSLSVLALYMNPNGTHGRPGFLKFAGARRVSEKTLQRHLEAAIAGGWLVLAQRGGRNGDGSTRANSYAAAIPGDLYPRLNEILGPVWGDMPLPSGRSQPDVHGLPVETAPPSPVEGPGQSQPDIHGCPVEDFSTGHLETSTGHSITSTGHPACPPTDHSHRPDTPISQSAQDLEGVHWLHGRGYGLTDQEALVVVKEARRRAANKIRSMVKYLTGMTEDEHGNPKADLAVIVDAVQTQRPPEPHPPVPQQTPQPPTWTVEPKAITQPPTVSDDAAQPPIDLDELLGGLRSRLAQAQTARKART